MKISAEWINDWLKQPLTEKDLVEALEKAGIEVEQFVPSRPLDPRIVVARVKTVVQHPNADKLRLVDVEIDHDQPVRVVCGAANVREGLKVALAQVGAVLPDGTVLKEAKLRGEISRGMLCSAQELGVGDDHEGIIELPDDAVVGSSVAGIFRSRPVIDIKTAANRPDLQSVVGLAREAAAMTGISLKDYQRPAGLEPDAKWLALREGLRADRFDLTKLSVDSSKRTPEWMKTRLEESGVRPISVVVDITNYVCLEMSQPMHAYDESKVKLPLNVRPAEKSERIKTLDGVVRNLGTEDLVVVDQNGPVAIAGVMGGADTEVDQNTAEILLEAAVFAGASVRKMAKRHGLRTEASARFERGLSVELPPLATARAVKLLQELAGAKVLSTSDQLNVWPWVQRIGLRVSTIERLMGIRVSARSAMEALSKLDTKAEVFDIAAESRSHLGRPYKWGAKFRTDGVDAFDCSYLTDYIYSLIGINIGHTAASQYGNGASVEVDDLLPGDLLFRGGPWDKLDEKERGGVSHVAIYVGDGKIIHAVDYRRDQRGDWVELDKGNQKVVEESVDMMVGDPQYLGARRYVESLGDFLSVAHVPWWRSDLKEDQDLVEEIVRIMGYDQIPSRIPMWKPQHLAFDTKQAKLRALRNLLVGAGLFEVMTYSFVSDEQIESVGLDPKDQLKIKNPLSSEQTYLRPMMLPSHLKVAAQNRSYAKEFGFFEISKVFAKRGVGEQPVETLSLAITVWRQDDSYYGLKGILDGIEHSFSVRFEYQSIASGFYAPGRAAEISLGKCLLGRAGQVSPEIVRRHKLTGELAHAEIDLDSLVLYYKDRQLLPISKFPGTYRDLSLVVPETLEWQKVENFILGLGLARVEFLSDFYGPGLPRGTKTIALRLSIDYPDRTPTDNDAAAMERRVTQALKEKFGANIRD